MILDSTFGIGIRIHPGRPNKMGGVYKEMI